MQRGMSPPRSFRSSSSETHFESAIPFSACGPPGLLPGVRDSRIDAAASSSDSESFEPFAVLSPFHYFLSSDPLVNGMDWGHAGVLVGIFVVLVAAAVPLFDRRDLRG